jgi:hypothetical protein
LTLALDPGIGGLGKKVGMENLDRYLLRELLGAFAQINGSHPSSAQQAQNAKWTDRLRNFGMGFGGQFHPV